MRLAQRAAEHGEILGEHVHEPAVDATEAGDDAIAVRALLVETEVVRPVRDESVEFGEAPLIEQLELVSHRHLQSAFSALSIAVRMASCACLKPSAEFAAVFTPRIPPRASG